MASLGEYFDPERTERIKVLQENDDLKDFIYQIIRVFDHGEDHKYEIIQDMIRNVIRDYNDTINIDDIICLVQDIGIKDNQNLITFLEELELSQVER